VGLLFALILGEDSLMRVAQKKSLLNYIFPYIARQTEGTLRIILMVCVISCEIFALLGYYAA